STLYVGYREYGGLYGDNYWMITKGLYINALIMEYLAVIGALDIVYIEPELGEFYQYLDYYDYDTDSHYDGLKYFRINALGAFLMGQAGVYTPATVEQPPLFSIGADHLVTLTAPAQMTPNDQHFLEQLAARDKKGGYRLDTGQLLTALEAGADLAHLTEFLTTCHDGPLPGSVQDWLAQVEQNTQAFKLSGSALLIEAKTAELAAMAAADPTLKKLCQRLGQKTLVVPANREKQFRARLKELEYILRE
ncbi:MAG: hypothetical protein R3264_22310, partial [Anaerolineae bacterium]|nr:hypothetical protein [Anaerolineae bacterium]